MFMKATVDRNSPIPLHRQIRDLLKEEIVAAEDGEELHLTERELTDRFKVSRAPVRHALKELADAGYLYRQRGQGTFPVRGLQLRPEALRLGGLSEFLKEQGMEASSSEPELGRIQPPEDVAKKLHLHNDTDVFLSSRVYTTQGQPLIWSRVYLNIPEPFNPTAQEIEAAGGLFALLRRNPDLHLTQGEHSIYADWATAEEARALSINEADPVLVMETTMFTRSGRLKGFRYMVHRPIDYKFVLTVTD